MTKYKCSFYLIVFVSFATLATQAQSVSSDQIARLQLIQDQLEHLSADRPLDIRMLLYTYYNESICQTCSKEETDLQKTKFKDALGSKFEVLAMPATYKLHKAELLKLFRDAPSLVPDEVATFRSPERILREPLFLTCIDFAKGFLALAKNHGTPSDDLRIVVLAEKLAFDKMCPLPGEFPTWPRPFLHTAIAYKVGKEWIILNPEAREDLSVHVGPDLPKRRELEISWASLGSKKMIVVGTIEAKEFARELPWQSLLNVIVSGNPNDKFCSK